jgi:hypothetical protein
VGERRVWVAQCLCGPQRHCIIAAAGEAEDRFGAEAAVLEPLRAQSAEQLRKGLLNPWCGLCHSPAANWFFDLGRTRWRTPAEARPALPQSEAEQAVTRALWADMRRGD